MKKALLAIVLASSFSPFLHSQKTDADEKKQTSVRLLCVAPALPSKYKRQPNGFYLPLPFDFDECPPNALSIKGKNGYKPVPFSANGISPEVIVHDDKAGGTEAGFYFQAMETTSAADMAQGRNKAPEAPKGAQGDKKPVAEWHLLAPFPKNDGKEHLTCVFNPNSHAKWYPAKTLDIDISPKVFTTAQCLSINLSSKSVYLQVGEKNAPIPLAPGGTFSISNAVPDAEGNVHLRAAAVTAPNTTEIVYNRIQPLPEGKRNVLVVSEAARNSGLPVEVNMFQIDDTTPTKNETKSPTAK